MRFLCLTSGFNIIERLKAESSESYLDMLYEFESQKQTIKTNESKKVTIRIPIKFTELASKVRGKSLAQIIRESEYSTEVKKRQNYSITV